MNENQRDTEHRPDEGKQVQQELERQLREFGDTMSDAFRHGFEGRGEEIGDTASTRRAAPCGRASRLTAGRQNRQAAMRLGPGRSSE